MNEVQTLCWNCKRAIGNCSWSDGTFTPVEGWKATPTVIYTDDKREVESFHVYYCPLYQPDKIESRPRVTMKPQRKPAKNTPRCRLMNLSRDKLLRLLNVLQGREKLYAELTLFYNYTSKDMEDYCGIKRSALEKVLHNAYAKMEAAI